MAETTEPPSARRKERLEALVHIEDKVEEAAEAAAEAAAHAVEAAKAAEAAQVARVAKKAKAAKTKAANTAKTAKSQAAKAARAAKSASKAAAQDAPQTMEPTGPLQIPTHVLDVLLTDDELAQIVRLAAEQELPVPDLARSLLVRALNRSGQP
jgi:peptidyl-prolyl cis-trans isomerase SurA